MDNFSKRALNMYGQVNTEFLYGYLNIMQHSLELQHKISNQYGDLLVPQFMKDIIKHNTGTWIHLIQNIDTVYIESLKNLKNNLRAINDNSILYIQSLGEGYGVLENMPSNIKNKELEILQKQSVFEETKAKNP